MKSKLNKAILSALCIVSYATVCGQVNTSLSNLVSPVAVNRDFTPINNNGLTLGLGAFNWKNIYIGTNYYLKNLRIIHSAGTNNFFAGPNAGNNTLTGTNNIALGNNVLGVITSGSWNTGIGFRALQANTTGGYNTAAGYTALYSNTTGGGNTASGYASLYYNTTGYANTAAGYNALFSNTTGWYNTADGYNALYSNTTGAYNTANGFQTLYYNTSGSYNTAIGFQALIYNITGHSNTIVGDFAGTSSGDFSNTAAIGYNAITTASNQIRMGNSSVTSIGGYVGWSIISDGRFKKNVQENVAGLEFINKLKAVTYTLDINGINNRISPKKINGEKPITDRIAISEKEKIIYSGFIAQDVEKAAKETGYDFNGVDVPKNETDMYSLRYDEFVVPLVKAVQQLSVHNDSLRQRVDELQQLNDNLQQRNTLLETRLSEIEKILKITPSVLTLSNSSVGQNSPNPFRGNTTISYTVPQGLSSAQIVVYDAAGKTLKQVNISATGRGTVNLDAAALPAGTYHYALFVDGKVVDTKKMVLMK